MLRKYFLFIVCVLLSNNAFSSDLKILMRVNDREYAVEDELTAAFLKEWNNNLSDLKESIIEDPLVEDIRFGTLKSINYRPSSEDNTIDVYFKIKDTRVDCDFIYILPPFLWGWPSAWFDISFKITLHSEFGQKGLILVIDNLNSNITNLRWDNPWLTIADLDGTIENMINPSIMSYCPTDSAIVILPLAAFSQMAGHPVVEGVDSVSLAESVLASFPFNFSFGYKDNKKYDNLVVNICLLPGYNEPNKENIYLSGNPTLPDANHVLSNIGISTCGTWPFPLIDPGNKYNWSWSDEIEQYCAEVGQGAGANYIRLEAVWNLVVPSISNIDPNSIPNFPIITDEDITNYITQITIMTNDHPNEMVGWTYLDKLISSANDNGLEPMILIGQGHSDRPPDYNNNDKSIAPGTVRGLNPENYTSVDSRVYLYYLEKYARAVVRKYRNEVNLWMGDGELNAARYNEAYDWWRKGSAWERDTFQDSVIMTLSKAVHDEDSDVGRQYIQTFHIFELSKRLDQWKTYYDAVALNFYPHEVELGNASPVLGFLVGELVYSTRRALDVLNKEVPVWISETGYPVTTNQALDPNATLCQHLRYFSQEKQNTFFEDVFKTCSKFGAEGLLWFLLIENKDNRYGLLDSTCAERLVYSTLKDEISGQPDPVWVEFNTEYQNSMEDLPGLIGINNLSTTFSNHETLRMYQTKTYTATTLSEALERPSTGDTVHHNCWNNEHTKYKVNKQFIPNDVLEETQNAQYYDKVDIFFQTSYEPETYCHTDISIRDPWYMEGDRSQDNIFRNLDTTLYQVFKDQNNDQQSGVPDYSIKAPAAISKQTEIRAFSGWEAYQNGSPVDISQNSSKIWILSPTNRETKVVVKDANIELRPRYQTVVNTIPGYTLTIPADDYLTISAGDSINFADGFTIEVKGELTIEGTASQPVTLQGAGRESSFTDPYTSTPTIEDTLIVSKGSGVIQMSNVIIKDTYCGLGIKDNASSVELENIEIKNCNVGIAIGKTDDAIMEFNRVNIHDCHVGVLFTEDFLDQDQTSTFLV